MERQLMREEALRRMSSLGLSKDVINGFWQDGTVCISEPPDGTCRRADERERHLISRWEEKTGHLIYTGIRSFTSLGQMVAYLYVSWYEEDWEQEWEDIGRRELSAFVYNEDAPELSESGEIGISAGPAGGLLREW